MNKSRDYYRYQRKRAILHKYNILRGLWGTEEADKMYVKGYLSKGKIHCSCWMCRRKSYDELSHRDKKKLIAYKQAINDYKRED